jgi:ferredoxin
MKYLSGVVTLHLNAGACVGCGVCAEVCPRGVLAIAHGTVVINDRDLCIECGACAKNCAYGAIGVKAGVGCAAAQNAVAADRHPKPKGAADRTP